MLGVLLMPLVTVLNEHDLEHYARFTLAVMKVEPEQHPFVRSGDISPASMEVHNQLAESLPHLPPDVFRRRLALGRTGDFENLAVNHQHLVEAIASGEAEAAGLAMHRHLASRSRRHAPPVAPTRNGQAFPTVRP